MSRYGFEKEAIAVVTGGAGFIGGECAMALSEDPLVKEVRIVDVAFPDFPLTSKMRYHRVDVRDYDTLLEATDGATIWFDNVGLLGTDNSVELGAYTQDALTVNVNGFLNQLQVAKRVGVSRMYHQTKPMFSHSFENAYTMTKKQAELLAFWARSTKGVPVTVATYFNASGHRQHLGPVRKMFPLFTVLALLDLDLSVYGSGKQLMDLIHVRDLVDASVLLTLQDDYSKPGKVYDIGTGQSVSVIDFAEQLISLTGSKSGIIHQSMRAGEKEDTSIRAATDDIKNLQDNYGWSPKFSLEDIIKEYVDYYRNTTDITYIKNCLLYFQSTGRYFTMNGQEVNIQNMDEDHIRNKLRG